MQLEEYIFGVKIIMTMFVGLSAHLFLSELLGPNLLYTYVIGM